MDNIETWRPVVGYEGLYEVSDWGRVRSLDRWIKNCKEGSMSLRKGAIMNGKVNNDGYRQVHLRINNKDKIFFVHRLVAEAFIPNPNNYPEVNHKDENKLNNRVDNLEWCTHRYNVNYGSRLERMAATQTNGKKAKKINQLTLSGELVKTWPSLAEIHRQLNYSCGNISQVCNGIWYSAYGYYWQFTD